MRVVLEQMSFREEVGCIIDWFYLRDIGIASQLLDCAFGRDELPKLENFCAANPQFHIVSRIGLRFTANRIDPRACHYYLANGNAEPDIIAYDRNLHCMGIPREVKA